MSSNEPPDYLNGLPMGELSNETVREYFDDPCNEWMDRDIYDMPIPYRPHIKSRDDVWMQDTHDKIEAYAVKHTGDVDFDSVKEWNEDRWEDMYKTLGLTEEEIRWVYTVMTPHYDEPNETCYYGCDQSSRR